MELTELTEHNALTKQARKKAGHDKVSVLTDPRKSFYIMIDASTSPVGMDYEYSASDMRCHFLSD